MLVGFVVGDVDIPVHDTRPTTKATHPAAACGLAMLLSFMSMDFCKRHQWEMVVMGPPGAVALAIPQLLSAVSPTLH